LIEHLAGKIADRILLQFAQAISVSVTVHKPSAPVSEVVTDIAVTIIRP
jgi:dihydroneopterin aldolase